MDDIDPSFEINQDPEVTKYTNDGGVKTYQQVYDAIKNNVLGDYQTHGYGRFAVRTQTRQTVYRFFRSQEYGGMECC